jgi:hypothetical protein
MLCFVDVYLANSCYILCVSFAHARGTWAGRRMLDLIGILTSVLAVVQGSPFPTTVVLEHLTELEELELALRGKVVHTLWIDGCRKLRSVWCRCKAAAAHAAHGAAGEQPTGPDSDALPKVWAVESAHVALPQSIRHALSAWLLSISFHPAVSHDGGGAGLWCSPPEVACSWHGFICCISYQLPDQGMSAQ